MLLAGVLIVLAYVLLATQTALLANVGQEAGRESANPLLSDYTLVRTTLGSAIEYELRNEAGVVKCPTNALEFEGRVKAVLELLALLEANRGQIFHGTFVSATIPTSNLDADPAHELETTADLFLTNGASTLAERIVYTTECTA